MMNYTQNYWFLDIVHCQLSGILVSAYTYVRFAKYLLEQNYFDNNLWIINKCMYV
jgi:hypothetical protein